MKVIGLLALLAALGAVYFVWVRPYLKSLPSFTQLWQEEEKFWAAAKAWVLGRRTILVGIWGELLIWLPDLLQTLSVVDLATALGWDDTKKALAHIVLTMAMLVFRTKASDQ